LRSGSIAFAVAGKTFSRASTLGARLGGGVIGCLVRLALGAIGALRAAALSSLCEGGLA